MAIYAELGRTPLIVQIAKLVVKYWFRIKSSLFSNTLVGKAANVCMELNLKSTIFLKYALQLYVGEKIAIHKLNYPTCRRNYLTQKKGMFAISGIT